MKSTIWKIAALVGVMGAGFLVVYQAQTNLVLRPPSADSPQSTDEFHPPEGIQDFKDLDADATRETDEDAQVVLGDSLPPQSDEPPPQQNEPDEEDPEPTLVWEAAPPQGTSNPFASTSEPTPAEEPDAPEQSSAEAPNPFAGFLGVPVKQESVAESEESATEAPESAAISLFGSLAADEENGPTEPEADSTDAINPFASTPFDSESLPPQDEAEPDPAADEWVADAPDAAAGPAAPEEETDGELQLTSHETDPFATGKAGRLNRLDPADDGPSLITPPSTDTETPAPDPAAPPEGDVNIPGLASVSEETETAEEPQFPQFEEQTGISRVSSEQPRAETGDAPALILPGSTSERSTTPDIEARSDAISVSPFGDPQTEPEVNSAPQPERPPVNNGPAERSAPGGDAVELTIQPRSRSFTDVEPQNETLPDQVSPEPVRGAPFNPFPEIQPPDESSEGSAQIDPFGTPPSESQAPENTFDSAPVQQQEIPQQRPQALPQLEQNRPATQSPPPLGPASLQGVGTLTTDSPLGTQQAQVTIEKEAPPDAVIGKPLVYSIHVRNVGRSLAENVIVKDVTPKGSRLVGTVPQAELDESDNRLIWRLGRMSPGDLKTIKIKVVPTDAGQIGSVATVSFEAAVAARTVVTAPQLKLKIEGPNEVRLGERASYRFTLINDGSADASGVYIRNLIPEGFEHPRGRDLEYEVGVLRRGQSKDIDLTLMAVQPGEFENRAELGADGDLLIEDSKSVSILASRLTLHRQGPENRFVGRSAHFTNTITNESREPLEDVSIVEIVPPGLDFETATEGGRFDPQRRTVTWVIRRLDPQLPKQVQAVFVPRQAGQYDAMVKAFDARGNAAEVSSQLMVAGFSSLKVDVAHDGAPVPVGEEVALRLSIRNRGTAAASDVRTLIEIPPQMRFVDARGPGRYRVVGNNLVEFEPIPTIEIDGEQQFDIVLTAAQRGDARVKVELQSADLTSPLNQEELVVIHPNQ